MSTFAVYCPGDSVLHGMPAGAKLVVLGGVAMLSVFIRQPWQVAVLLLGVGALFVVARIPWRVALARWRAQRIDVGIFSSGSVLAQQLLFRHSSAGDLTPLLRWHFDTTTGPKTDPESYRRIAAAMGIPAANVLFVSDIAAELDAARTAGMQTRLSIRPGNRPPPLGHGHTEIRTFDELTGQEA